MFPSSAHGREYRAQASFTAFEYAKHTFPKIRRNISALPKILAKASMRNTNFKKYAGLSKWSQRGGLENLQSRFFANAQNPLLRLMFSPFGRSRKLFLLKLFLKNSQI